MSFSDSDNIEAGSSSWTGWAVSSLTSRIYGQQQQQQQEQQQQPQKQQQKPNASAAEPPNKPKPETSPNSKSFFHIFNCFLRFDNFLSLNVDMGLKSIRDEIFVEDPKLCPIP